MAITTVDGLLSAMPAGVLRPFNKTSVSAMPAGYASLWLNGSVPAAGGGSTVEYPTSATTGAISIPNATGGAKNYLAKMAWLTTTAGNGLVLLDRLAHCAALDATSTSLQTLNIDLTTSGSNIPARKGASDYSEVQWWIEVATTVGTTARDITVDYENQSGASGSTVVSVGGSTNAGVAPRMVQIVPASGDSIREVVSTQLATGLASGTYRVIATRFISDIMAAAANAVVNADWALLGLPVIEDDACLMLACLTATTVSGTNVGSLKFVTG